MVLLKGLEPRLKIITIDHTVIDIPLKSSKNIGYLPENYLIKKVYFTKMGKNKGLQAQGFMFQVQVVARRDSRYFFVPVVITQPHNFLHMLR